MSPKLPKSTKNGTLPIEPAFKIAFYRSSSGRESVREWLRQLDAASRRHIGEDLRRLQYHWPIGMPLVRKLDAGLWEMRSKVPGGITRIVFTIHADALVLLHGWVKKTRKLPVRERRTAKLRLIDFRNRIRI